LSLGIDLTDMRVRVTGGGSGIGRCIAETMAACGARVAICDAAPGALEEMGAANPQIARYACDVSDEAQVDALFDAVAKDLGGLDVMVNNAGITGPFGAIETLTTADWVKTFGVNVHGMFFCTRRAVPLLKAAGKGLIINLSSITGRLGYALRTPYSASKWAVIGLTESLAIELGPSKIRVNALLPGFVAGPRHERNAHARAALLGITYEEQKRRIMSTISMRDLTQPQDVANMAVFLASPLGAHISGQSISVCGNVETLGG
jgi:NAD(P)-dependent dehydrogenase (short-subunit alcohol dehydrogenase family)